MKKIENVLLGYHGVKQSVVLDKEHIDSNCNPTGSKYLVAYYVKETETIEEDKGILISDWETIYQSEYSSLDINNFKYNISGWNSSYTQEPIPREDMFEWVEESVNKIKSLSPKVILEIGSGSGLILFNIIDDCDYYYATDFSKNAIDYTRNVIDRFGYKNKVALAACAADAIQFHELDIAYDTVILNSNSTFYNFIFD